MAVRLWDLPWDPETKKLPRDCQLVTDAISKAEFKKIAGKLHLPSPRIYYQEVLRSFQQAGSLDHPPDPFREFVEEYVEEFVKELPYFQIGIKELEDLAASGEVPTFVEALKSFMEKVGQNVLQIGYDEVGESEKKYSVSGSLSADTGKPYLLWFVELDVVSNDDLLGWRWVCGERNSFVLHYDEEDFRWDIDDLIDKEPELSVMVLEWDGEKLRKIGRCVKKWGVKTSEELKLAISDGKIKIVEGSGWSCQEN